MISNVETRLAALEKKVAEQQEYIEFLKSYVGTPETVKESMKKFNKQVKEITKSQKETRKKLEKLKNKRLEVPKAMTQICFDCNAVRSSMEMR